MTELDIRKDAFKNTLDWWRWLAKTGSLSKSDWHRYDTIRSYRCQCAFCSYFASCEKCPLGQALGKCSCESDYNNWSFATMKDERQRHAEIIYQFIDKWYNEKFNGGKE